MATLQQPENRAEVACLQAADQAAQALREAGFSGCPSWQEVWRGARPPPPVRTEPGDWPHGWQHHASSALDNHFRETVVLPRMKLADRAMLRSQSGPWSGTALAAVPTTTATTMQAEAFQVLLRRRLRLRLPLQPRRCGARHCQARLDRKGDHYAACPFSGWLRRRAGPMEAALRRVLRETGARVVPNARLRDLGVPGAPRRDGRNVEAAA